MKNTQDRAFMRQFSAVIVGFLLLTIVLVFVARSLQKAPDESVNPSQKMFAEQRIEPVAGVRVAEEGSGAPPAEETTLPAPEPAVVAVVDGAEVYDGLCKTCHDAGVAGSPLPGSEEMAARLEERGLDGLVHNAINGINAMPPRGGNPALTDEQIRAAVEYMLP